MCLYWSLCVPFVFVCVSDIKFEYRQNPCNPCQCFSKFNALLHKTYSKVLLLLSSKTLRIKVHNVITRNNCGEVTKSA